MMLAGLSILLALLVGIVVGARLQMRILRRQTRRAAVAETATADTPRVHDIVRISPELRRQFHAEIEYLGLIYITTLTHERTFQF